MQKAVIIEAESDCMAALNSYLNDGWSVHSMEAFRSGGYILVILEKA